MNQKLNQSIFVSVVFKPGSHLQEFPPRSPLEKK